MGKNVMKSHPCRQAVRVLLAAVLGAIASVGQASDFYRLTVIADSSGQAGPDWRILTGAVGINNAGVVTWRADRIVNGASENGIFIGNGIGQPTTIAIGSVQNPSINNRGQVAYSTPILNPQGSGNVLATRVWDPIGTIDLCISNQQPTPLICFSESLSDTIPPRTTYRRSVADLPFGIVAPLNQVVSDASIFESNFPNFPPAISRNGQDVAWSGGAGGVTNRIVMTGPAVGGRADLIFPHTPNVLSDYIIQGLSVNDQGNTAFVSTGNRRMVGVISTRAGVPSAIQVADNSTGQFIDFRESPSINNLNEVAFAGQVSAGVLPFVGDVSGRPSTQVVLAGEVVATDGTTIIGGVFQNGFFPHSMNDKGQIAFITTLNRPGTGPGTGQRFAIVRGDPLLGVSPGNPIMPAPGATLPSGWRFVLNCQPRSFCVPRFRRYIDPPLAVGYTYQVEAPGPNFATVYIPAPLANGDDTFQVEFNGQVAPLRAGQEFDFTTVVPGGVSSFRITGIDTAEALDPTNAAAFVTGLSFATEAPGDFSITMVPIVEDPDDLDRDGVPNANDLCPNTAPGAIVDANGCSADQRDSDGDGVVDSLDQCPATPLGTTVNANGCSALQLDSDGDGVPNTADACPGTAPGAAVDARGCSAAQRDNDGDGIADSLDQCPNTPTGAPVNAVGCATSQLDSDGDGVADSVDQCPNTPTGAAVIANGCSAAQLDSDGDGVPDSVDLCPGTPTGTPVDATGCPVPQPTRVCDVNGDNFVDYRDIRLIILAIGKPASGANDPRDANRNGRIDLIDAAICTSRCSRLLCLPPR